MSQIQITMVILTTHLTMNFSVCEVEAQSIRRCIWVKPKWLFLIPGANLTSIRLLTYCIFYFVTDLVMRGAGVGSEEDLELLRGPLMKMWRDWLQLLPWLVLASLPGNSHRGKTQSNITWLFMAHFHGSAYRRILCLRSLLSDNCACAEFLR